MSLRSKTILAVAAATLLLCLYTTSAQVPERPGAREEFVPKVSAEPGLTDGAIIQGPPPVRLPQELPGRFQMQAATGAGGTLRLALVDSHTGQCWTHEGGRWRDLGSPAKVE